MELSQFGMSSGLLLVHLHPASVVEPGGSNKAPASVRDRLSPAREREASVESLSTSPSTVGRDASDGRKQRCWLPLFFLLQMGATRSRVTPLDCVLKNWDKFDSQSLKKTSPLSFENLHGHNIHWRVEDNGHLKDLNYYCFIARLVL